jgi:diacylglycerol kinase (ATP)
VHRMDRWRCAGRGLKRVRRSSYFPKILSTALSYPYPELVVEADGREMTGAHLFVFNLPAYGGGLKLAPAGCTAEDGLLDWVLFEKPGLFPLLGDVLAVKRGKHLDRPGVLHGRAGELSIRSQGQAPVQIDGDPGGFAPMRITVAQDLSLELLKTG